MTGRATFARQGEIGIVTLENPPLNLLNSELISSMLDRLREAQEDRRIRAVVLTGSGTAFCAGGDLKLLPPNIPADRAGILDWHVRLRVLEDSFLPVVCAIQGPALGGGLQIALACHYRIAAAGALLGEPEVKLGLIPNGGGTPRLVRLTGTAKAAEMVAWGKVLTAAAAAECGLLDAVVPDRLLEAAVEFARNLLAAGRGPRRTRDAALKEPPGAAPFSHDTARDLARRKFRGRQAPLKAMDAVEAAARLPFEEACLREEELFRECLFSEEARSLVHVFLSERAGRRSPKSAKAAWDSSGLRAAVAGAGTMGSGIAIVYASAGIPVLLHDQSPEALDRSLGAIRRWLERQARKEDVSREAAEACFGLIRPVFAEEDLREAGIVIEAVDEDLDAKRQVLGILDRICGPDAIFASNTSSLDIDLLAIATRRPERVVGHHFFAPAPVMRLLEIVRGLETSEAVLAASLEIASRLGKVGIVVKNAPGPAGNRIYHRYQREAQLLLEEGASVPQVDEALYRFGMAMGPLAVADLSGLDVGWRIRRSAAPPADGPGGAPLAADRLCTLGRLGQKTGAGWYRYEPGDRRPVPDPYVEAVIDACSREKGIVRRPVSDDEIVERSIYAIINEGARLLGCGAIARPSDIDVIFVDGYGFPRHLGGPMWYAGRVGFGEVYRRIRDFHRAHGARWTPAPLLEQLAESGGDFSKAGLDRQGT